MKRLLFLASTLTISFSLHGIGKGGSRIFLYIPGCAGGYSSHSLWHQDAGSVVGSYYDATGGYGFIATAQPGDPTYNASVPEPSTLLLLGSGFAGLAVFRKRFKE